MDKTGIEIFNLMLRYGINRKIAYPIIVASYYLDGIGDLLSEWIEEQDPEQRDCIIQDIIHLLLPLAIRELQR